MDRAVEYQHRAEEAERKAAEARDAKTKLQLLDLADTWRNLAYQAGGQQPSPPSERRHASPQ
jgi:hypothetical protein